MHATAGPLLIAFFVESTARVPPESAVSAVRALPRLPVGTQIDISVDHIRR